MSFADDLNSVAKPPQQVQTEEKKKAIEVYIMYRQTNLQKIWYYICIV